MRRPDACDFRELLVLCSIAGLPASKALEYHDRGASYADLLAELSGVKSPPTAEELAIEQFAHADVASQIQ